MQSRNFTQLVFPHGNSVSNQSDLSNSRPKTTATHPRHMRLRLLENWESPTSATNNCKTIPSSASGSTQRSARFWPLHPPTSYTALAPRTSAATHTRLCKQNMSYTAPLWTGLQRKLRFSSCVDVKSLLSNFSIRAFSSQRASMDEEGQKAVFTHFIKPFLSRNDSSGKGRRSDSIW